MSKELIGQDWFQSLIDDCDALITESVFNARWGLIQGHHELGKRILQEKANFELSGLTGQKIVQRVAESLKKSQRTIYYAIQFAEAYPDIDKLPGGKDVSWHKVCKELLPSNTKPICSHEDYEEIVIKKCKHCHKRL